MNKRYYILLSFFFALIVSIGKVDAQYADVVCAGDVRVYKTTGNAGSTFQWTIDGGGTITQPYGDSIEVTWGNKPGIYNIQVVQTSKYGCKGAPLVAAVKLSVPGEINLGNDMKLCEGQTITLDAGADFTNYNWSNGSTNRQVIANKAGMYKIIATDANGCAVADSISIEMAATPRVNLGRDTSLCDGETLELTAGPFTDTLTYLWSDKSTGYNKLATASDFPMVSVTVTNQNGCSASDTIIILPCDIRKYFSNAQNTITPNGDGKNDTWIIPLLDNYPNTRVQIYDRWGRIVFQSEHGLPPGGWDGTSNGRPLPMDSYQYIIDLKVNGIKATGIITIIR
ncbi:MAG TPA: gliding motility-associated C-terminal domain-containing protein [Bacteroidales bacterium]